MNQRPGVAAQPRRRTVGLCDEDPLSPGDGDGIGARVVPLTFGGDPVGLLLAKKFAMPAYQTEGCMKLQTPVKVGGVKQHTDRPTSGAAS